MRMGLTCAAIVLLLAGVTFATMAGAQQGGPMAAPTTTIAVQPLPPAPSPQSGFDALKATNAYLAQVHGAARARSDSYFEGGYVLILVDAIYAVLVSAILLWLRISARMRDFARGITGRYRSMRLSTRFSPSR
jgi:STE24 endopeptidase